MSLKVELKPNERIIIGNCLVTNADQRTRLYIDGTAPVLREKDILTPETADSPCKRIYFAIQLMYLEDDIGTHRETYFSLVDDVVQAAPSTLRFIDEMNNEILTGSLYKALKTARKLIQYEEELISNATAGGAGLPRRGTADDGAA